MESSKPVQRQNTLVRALPYILLAIAALKLTDWIYSGRTERFYLFGALGFLLLGASSLVQNKLVAAGRLSPGMRWSLLALGILGTVIALWASVQRWL